jgi:uncharacterized repeat protein (TIGR03917 family)
MAGARGIGDGYYEIAIQPGADAADVSAAIDAIPLGAAFVEVYDDVDTVLIFHQTPPGTTVSVRVPVRPTSPKPVAAAVAAASE